MSKVIYVCNRQKPFEEKDKQQIHNICDHLIPDNISPLPHKISRRRNVAYGITNPIARLLKEDGNSLLIGLLFEENKCWAEPFSGFPDGSFALFRDNTDYLEVVSDPAASRTLWYYFDEDLFIASSSQRAIIMYIGSFMFDERVIPWMFSTGTLGPSFSWDKRLKRIPPDSSVILNKKEWSVSTKNLPIIFSPEERPDEEHASLLKKTILDTFSFLQDLDYNNWVLSLSGGYDSRGLLCFLNKIIGDNKGFETITWGLKSSVNETGKDVYVARKLAERFGVSHRYYHTDSVNESFSKIIDRYLQCGEGRTDKLSGNMEEIWSNLFKDGVSGIIRGDEGFGWLPVTSAFTVRWSLGYTLCTDFSNLKTITDKYDLPVQEAPVDLLQKKEESLDTWRDRLYQSYRYPAIMSAISDLKFAYVEQVNPYLSRNILNQVRKLPDHLRTNKHLFKKIVNDLSPDVPYAKYPSISSPQDFLRKQEVVRIIQEELFTEQTQSLFPVDFLELVMSGIKAERGDENKPSKRLKIGMRRVTPKFIKNKLRDAKAPRLDGNVLAFRVFLISRMFTRLTDDSKIINNYHRL